MSSHKLKTMNILDLDYGVYNQICQLIDTKWRDLAELADGTRYKMDAIDVENCAKVLVHNINGCPAHELLKKFGNANMTVGELARMLDDLHLERPLTCIRDPEELVIIEDCQQSISVDEGDQVVLSCKAVGFPYPVYCWFKGQQQLTASDTGTLVHACTRLSDAGTYVCRIHHVNHVTNKPDYKFTSWCLVTVNPRSIQQLPPVTHSPTKSGGCQPNIVVHPKSQTIQNGSVLTLSCQAYGQPDPEYHWIKNGALIQSGQLLCISSVCLDDVGEYVCIAKNSIGEAKSNPAIISFPSSQKDSCIQVPVKPQIIKEPVDQTHGIGGEAVFDVEAYYHSPLSYQWYHNSDLIPEGTSAKLRIKVNGFYLKGSYQCRIHAADRQEVLTRQATLTVTPGPNVYTAADKLALFIGVSTYKIHGVPLPAVENDLQESVKVFEAMEFKVVSFLDLTLAEMKAAIRMFCELLTPDVYVVFYCAGHGFIAEDGYHYLIPWDAHHDANPNESLCIESIEEELQKAKPKLLMFFLDICRKRHQTPDPPSRSFVRGEAVANKIVLYAASEGQQAFEESGKLSPIPRGLFNKYLLDVVNKPLPVIELYFAIVDKFKACPFDRNKYRQSPALLANSEDYGRTLLDPINSKLYRDTVNQKTSLWESLHRLPPETVLPLNTAWKVSIKFKRVTSNVMELYAVPLLTADWHLAVYIKEEEIPSALRPVKMHSVNGVSCFRFMNLQRLRDNLVIRLHFVLINKANESQFVRLDPFQYALQLGQPLVAARNVRSCTDISEPTQRKKPMEHLEDNSVPSDSSLSDNSLQ